MKVHSGDRATLDDERFSPEAGQLGLWQAADFARKWAGVKAANGGVDRSPVVLPSWIDVAEGSSFLTVLTEKPFPPELPHYLFFGFEGGNGSDGIIALKSQLEEKMQRAAKQVFGFPDDHTAILRSPAVAEKLNLVLAAP